MGDKTWVMGQLRGTSQNHRFIESLEQNQSKTFYGTVQSINPSMERIWLFSGTKHILSILTMAMCS